MSMPGLDSTKVVFFHNIEYIDGLVQDCSKCIANTLELL